MDAVGERWCNPLVAFGWVMAGIGAVVLVWPRGLVWIAHYYRAGVPSEPRDATAVAARFGGLIVVAVGLTVALTS
jgi:hypothetical protein